MFTIKQIQSFNDLDQEIYQCIMIHLDQVPYYRIRELADAVHVSTSTILRFCKKVGCEGYSEFKVNLKQYA